MMIGQTLPDVNIVRGRVPGDIAEILIADDYPHRIARRIQPPMTHNHPHQPPSISGTLHHNTHTPHTRYTRTSLKTQYSTYKHEHDDEEDVCITKSSAPTKYIHPNPKIIIVE